MNLKEVLNTISLNQKQIESFGKFDVEILKKINYKFRLDWNYYSNRMEGGTLTRDETRSVMVGNIDVKGKPLKDIMEMDGHDKIILEILKIGKGEQRISEKRIKEIHKAIMHEGDERKSQIGNWKTFPNEIINYKSEKISFTAPVDVPTEIHTALDKANAELDAFFSGKKSKNPLEIAAKFHIDFVSIHPFYDGNGRTARILTNLILISCGYPPIIIKDDIKKPYYQLLADIQVYGGQADLFYAFIGERLIESQQLILNAFEGKDIEELDDVDKEIDLFKKQVAAKESVGTKKKDTNLIIDLYFKFVEDFFKAIKEKHESFDELFGENFYQTMINQSHDSISGFSYLGNKIEKEANNAKQHIVSTLQISDFCFQTRHRAYQKDGLNLFDVNHFITIKFDDFKFHVGDNYANHFEFGYSNLPDTTLQREIVSKMIKSHFADIKSKIQKIG